jgi:hypothetical protein
MFCETFRTCQHVSKVDTETIEIMFEKLQGVMHNLFKLRKYLGNLWARATLLRGAISLEMGHWFLRLDTRVTTCNIEFSELL